MKRYWTIIWKTVGVPFGMAVVLLLAFAVWSFYRYGGVRYGFDRLNGYAIVAVEPVVDLGEVEPGQTVTALFRLKNLSGKEVTVLGAESECRCAVSDVFPLRIPPYVEVELPISMVFPSNNVGSMAKQLRLFFDIDHIQTVIFVKATVSPVSQETIVDGSTLFFVFFRTDMWRLK